MILILLYTFILLVSIRIVENTIKFFALDIAIKKASWYNKIGRRSIMDKIIYSPSLICLDLLSIRSEVQEIENLGCEFLHVDVIDGQYSPDNPLAIDTVKKLRKETNLIFDAHLMSKNNETFVELLLDCGVDRLCFHTEYEPRPTILLRKIKNAGCKAGIAISPETSLESVKHLLWLCDFVLFMRIDAGYAHLPQTEPYPFLMDKILEFYRYTRKNGLPVQFEVDGRVGFEDIEPLCRVGVSVFVLGSKSLFSSAHSWAENWSKLKKIASRAEEKATN